MCGTFFFFVSRIDWTNCRGYTDWQVLELSMFCSLHVLLFALLPIKMKSNTPGPLAGPRTAARKPSSGDYDHVPILAGVTNTTVEDHSRSLRVRKLRFAFRCFVPSFLPAASMPAGGTVLKPRSPCDLVPSGTFTEVAFPSTRVPVAWSLVRTRSAVFGFAGFALFCSFQICNRSWATLSFQSTATSTIFRMTHACILLLAHDFKRPHDILITALLCGFVLC